MSYTLEYYLILVYRHCGILLYTMIEKNGSCNTLRHDVPCVQRFTRRGLYRTKRFGVDLSHEK